jgi:hypothetical protein
LYDSIQENAGVIYFVYFESVQNNRELACGKRNLMASDILMLKAKIGQAHLQINQLHHRKSPSVHILERVQMLLP